MNDATGRGQLGGTRNGTQDVSRETWIDLVMGNRRARGVGLLRRRGWVIPPSRMRPQEKNYPLHAREFSRWTLHARSHGGREQLSRARQGRDRVRRRALPHVAKVNQHRRRRRG